MATSAAERPGFWGWNESTNEIVQSWGWVGALETYVSTPDERVQFWGWNSGNNEVAQFWGWVPSAEHVIEVLHMTLAVTAPAVATLQRNISSIRTATASSVATLTRASSKTLTATSSSTASVIRGMSVILSTTALVTVWMHRFLSMTLPTVTSATTALVLVYQMVKSECVRRAHPHVDSRPRAPYGPHSAIHQNSDAPRKRFKKRR